MTKPNLKVTAAKLAAVASKSGGVFVFATRDANLPKIENVSAAIAAYPFAEHTCGQCTAVFSAVKAPGLQNHCIACGSDKAVAARVETKPKLPDDSKLAYLTCASCGVFNVFPTSIGKEIASSMCCTACGSGLHASAELSDGGNSDTVSMDDMDVLDLGDDDIEDLDGDTEDVVLSENTMGDPEDDAESLEDGAPASATPPEPTGVDTDPALVTPAVETTMDPVDPANLAKASVRMNLLKATTKDAELSFAYVGAKMAVLANMQIVATLSKEDAGDYVDMMQTETFRTSVAHVISTKGIQAIESTYGFKPAIVNVPIKAMLEEAVDSKTAKDKKKVQASLDQVTESFQQAVDISAAGYASNFWKNKPDVVKAALIAELSSIGVSNPTRLVDRIYAAHGVKQLRDVITLARELANKPAEALNGLADAIDMSKYRPTTASDDTKDTDEGDQNEVQDDDEDEEDEESSVTSIATAIDFPSDTIVTASVKYKDKALATILGDKPLTF